MPPSVWRPVWSLSSSFERRQGDPTDKPITPNKIRKNGLNTNQTYHIYNRGNNRQKIFYTEANYLYFLNKLNAHLNPISDILAYCLMPNHFHLIIYTNELSCKAYKDNRRGVQNLNFQIGKMLSSYSQAINSQLGRSGSIFQQKTKSKALTLDKSSEDYLLTAFNYVHQNPLKAGLVSKMEDWKYSSFTEYLKKEDRLCNQKKFYELSGWDSDNFYEDSYGIRID